MNIRTPQSGNAARIAKAYLKTLGIDLKHAQSLELIARLHGYTDNQAMQSDPNFQDPLALVAEGSTDFKMVSPRQSSVYVTVENISVYIKRDDEGVSVDLFPLGREMEESLAGTHALYDEARELCDRCGSDLDEKGYCTDSTCPHHDWPQEVNCADLETMSQAQVEAKYSVTKRELVAEESSRNLVLVYGDHLENFSDEAAAAQFIEKRLPKRLADALPDRAFWEDQDCKELADVEFVVTNGRVTVLPADRAVVYAFEAEGFVSTGEELETLQNRSVGLSLTNLFAYHQKELTALGFTGLREVYVSEDEGQADRDLKVFVCVYLEGPRNLKLPAVTSPELSTVLAQVAQAVCLDSAGCDAVGPHSWELADKYTGR